MLADYEGTAFTSAGTVEAELLATTAVHPMREDAVRALLDRGKAEWSIVERLVRQGQLRRTDYEGKTFFVNNHTTQDVRKNG
jgi:hypothetical protein